MNVQRTLFSISQKGKRRLRERWNNILNVYTNDIQARHSAFRAPAVNQKVLLNIDIVSWAPMKITSHCPKSKKWRAGEDTGDFFRPEGSSFGNTYANLDKVSKKLSSAQPTTTPQALPRLQKQETMFLSPSYSFSSNSCENGSFPLPYGEWGPVTNSEISSNIISSNTSLKRSLKENSARRPTPPQQVTLLLRTDTPGEGTEVLGPTTVRFFCFIPFPGCSPEKPHLPAWPWR